jgi:hypothetical protein
LGLGAGLGMGGGLGGGRLEGGRCGGGGVSDGRSGVGSTPLVCVWGVCVVLSLSWFLSNSISLVLPRSQSMQ